MLYGWWMMNRIIYSKWNPKLNHFGSTKLGPVICQNPAVKFHFRAHARSTVGDSDPDSNRRQGRGLPPNEEPPKKTPLKEPLIKLRGPPKALARYNLNDKHSAKNLIFCLLLLVVQGDGKAGAVAADSMEAASSNGGGGGGGGGSSPG